MILKGKTQKGRNVIQRDGKRWEVKRMSSHVLCFDGRPGWLIAPVSTTAGCSRQWRWIETRNDANFTIEHIDADRI